MPAIRAVVRTAVPLGHDVIGIRRGYKGLLEEDFYYSFHRNDHQMHLRSVSNIIHRGGAILHTSRCEPFKTEEGLRAAAAILQRNRIDNLVAIGGDGTSGDASSSRGTGTAGSSAVPAPSTTISPAPTSASASRRP